jgi:hypothetical protein
MEDFQWHIRLLIPAYREIQGVDEPEHNSSDSLTGICAVRALQYDCRTLREERTHPCVSQYWMTNPLNCDG